MKFNSFEAEGEIYDNVRKWRLMKSKLIKFKKIVYFFIELRYSKNYQKNKINTMIGFQ